MWNNTKRFWSKLTGKQKLMVIAGIFLLGIIGKITDKKPSRNVSTQSNSSQTKIEEEESVSSSEASEEKPVTASSGKFYEGGTLHKATIAEWRKAEIHNKIATCADFIAKSFEMNGTDVSKITMKEWELACHGLNKCIETSVPETPEFNNQSVTELAAMCLLLAEQEVKQK